VSKTRRTRTYRTPTREEHSKIYRLGFDLADLFDEDEIEDLTAAAKRRLVGEFHYATEKNPRYKLGSDRRTQRRTDNYILGLRNKPSDLARYVRQNMHRPFIRPSQLPSDLAELPPKMIDMIIQGAQQDILELVIQVMRNREIWYDEAVGIWQACQSVVDEFLEYKRASRALSKVDHREYHGRNRQQSVRRSIPAGVSVGFA
jgi:hypothetical protein